MECSRNSANDRLGRDAGHAGDRDVGAAGAVDELEVDVDRLPVAAEPDGNLLVAHLIEVQRRVTLLPRCARDYRAGHRRHVHLGLDPGHGDLRDLRDLRRQRALLDQEHIRREPRTLMYRLDVRDDTRHLHRRQSRQLQARHHHVVKLQVLLRADRHRELQRRRRNCPNNQTNGLVSVQLVVPHSASQIQVGRQGKPL